MATRGLKVGREEMIGMLVAVESWVGDQAAEWAQWVAPCQHIADRALANSRGLPWCEVSRREPVEPQPAGDRVLGISPVGITARRGRPPYMVSRIAGGAGDATTDARHTIRSTRMVPGETRSLPTRHEVLSAKHTLAGGAPKPPTADLTGNGRSRSYAASRHAFLHPGNDLRHHQGEFMAREIMGRIVGMLSRWRADHGTAGFSPNYTFKGNVTRRASQPRW
jgi:L-seryl-tRNA(Ser) seleniumtransferase